MLVIPVIDMRGREVVAALRGERKAYKRLATPLAETADPAAVTAGLEALFPFPILYVADLDGIEGRGADLDMQRRVTQAWSGTELWIDDGQGSAERLLPKQVSVLGSETFATPHAYAGARVAAGPDAPLSLDFRGDAFLGPAELLEDTTLWPDRIIVMTLARVGSGEGPDLARLRAVVARAGHRSVFAAGGVRDVDDLAALREIGVAGALVAHALHSGAITRNDLDAIGAGRREAQ